MRVYGLLALALACAGACSEAPQPFDPDLYVTSTRPPRPPKGRIWLRKGGETKLWWADDLRREDLVPCVSTWDAVEEAEKQGIPFLEVEMVRDSLIGRNEEGEVVITYPRSKEGPCRYSADDVGAFAPKGGRPPPATSSPPNRPAFPPAPR